MTKTAPKKRKAAKRDWICNECGRKMTFKVAEKAMMGVNGCPKCGGVDIEFVGIL